MSGGLTCIFNLLNSLPVANNSNNNEFNGSHLAFAIGGVLAGSWFARKTIQDSKKSRAERDFPTETEEVYEEISNLLKEWEPDDNCETEYDFMIDLHDYLEENTDLRLEIEPKTNEGHPDILVEALIALELKVNPSKAERNRCVGQCAQYSREFLTMMIIVDSPPSKIDEMYKLLIDKGLEQIEVWDVS